MGGESTMKNLVKRVKEIVHDFSDEEIHAMLEECDMDPNEAVQRLLVQDTFHEVKSKRERRKEVKETQELKFWGGSNVDLDDGNFSNAYKKETASVTSSLSRSSDDYPSMAKAIGQKSSDMSASVNGENREPLGNVINSSVQSTTESKPPGLPTGGKNTSTADNVKVSPRWAEARSYLQDVMQRSEGYDSVHSKTKSGSGGASGCRHDLFEQISPRSQTICHQSSRDSAAVRAMSTSLESDHTSSESSEKVDGGVLLPSHVQSLAAECSNLTFGTYKTHSPSTNSGQHKSDLSVKEDGASMQQRYLPEHLLNDILESDNDLSGGNQEEVLKEQQNMGTSLGYESLPESDSISQYIQYDRNLDNSLPFQEVRSYSSDVLRNMESESSMESSRHLLRQQGMFSASYPPDEARYNAAVSYMKKQAISIPEKILGDDYRAAAKLPHHLIGPPSQYNHTRDRLGNWRDPPNTPQNYGHRLSDEHFCQYLAAAINKRQDHPLTSLVPSSIDASRFRSLANRRGSFLPNASIGSSAPPGFQSQFKNPNPFRRQIRSIPALDHRFRSGAMLNAQEQRAYDSSSVEAQQKYRYLVDNDLLHAFDSNLSLKPNNWRPNY